MGGQSRVRPSPPAPLPTGEGSRIEHGWSFDRLRMNGGGGSVEGTPLTPGPSPNRRGEPNQTWMVLRQAQDERGWGVSRGHAPHPRPLSQQERGRSNPTWMILRQAQDQRGWGVSRGHAPHPRPLSQQERGRSNPTWMTLRQAQDERRRCSAGIASGRGRRRWPLAWRRRWH